MPRISVLPKVLEALRSKAAKKRGLTQLEIQKIANISAGPVSTHIRRLHAQRAVHIAGWMTDVGGPKGGRYQARYQLGDKPDIPKPPCLTRAEVSRRFMEKARKTGTIEDVFAKKRAYWWRKQPPRRDPLAAAFFGHAATERSASWME